MKTANSVLSLGIAAALAAILGAKPGLTGAAQADLAQAPLGTSASATVLPNLMFILDNSTSMRSDNMPDEVDEVNACKTCGSSSCDVVGTTCKRADAPYFAGEFNSLYYNPQVTYAPAVDSTGASLGSADPTAAKDDPYLGGGTKNLTNTYREMYFCTSSSPSSSDLTDTSKCRRNGINMPGSSFTFNNTSTDGSGGYPTTGFRNAVTKDITNPYFFVISPREHCTDDTLVNCVASTVPTATNPVPAPVRYCKTAAFAADPAVVSGLGGSPATTAKCKSKTDSTYKYTRFGNFTRTDIKSSVSTYGNRPNRTDCAAKPNCTYAEELQNFANWYSYYRIRASLMKTVTGQAFLGLDDRYRIGFVTINVGSPASEYYLKLNKFDATHRSAWYNTLYNSPHISGTPLKEALSRVGRHYGGKTDGINSDLPDDPVQFSCQQNFALLTTDGYYDSDPGKKLDGSNMDNQDNVDAGFSKRQDGLYGGYYDGNLNGSKDTLADVAMYYYKTDLRPTGAVSKDNVPTTDKDKAAHQHMVTFTLGLGLDGLMTYRPDYETATTGDFAKIKAGQPSGCSWTNGTCNWPEPKSGQPTALDDLWHAAVNGRGLYFSAKRTQDLKSGLATALATIQITTGAAAASATSTPNITPTDNFIFSSTYRTVKWDGEVIAEQINTTDGTVLPGVVWSAGSQLDARVTINSDTRTIYTFTTVFADNRKAFTYANMSIPQRAHFDNKCASLPQCPSLTPGQQGVVNNGDNLIRWLRGQSKKEDGVVFRDREHVLGDVVNAKPAFVAEPTLLYGDAVTPTYSSFKTANASRQAVLYIAANDGMLHAFNADTGAEIWAWVPRMLWPELYKLASTTYDKSHRFYVDGSPVVMDVFFKSVNQWKTVLVGGLNAGGRGYYAIDITNPSSPKGLWEFCSDPTGKLECTEKDDNVGYTYGQPIITKDPKDGNWVVMVSSGYNNVLPGDGKGYLYILDVETGKLIDKKDTGVGDATTPSGFAKITGFALNFAVNNTTTFVYGGDLLGNMFSFDVQNRQFQLIGQARDASGKMQSITTRPDITRFDTPAPAFNVVYFGTGRFLGATDIPDPVTLGVLDLAYQQTVYGIKDTGSNLGDLRASGAKLVQQTLSVVDPISRTVSQNAVDWSTQNGWYVDLNPAGDSPGERVSIDPQLVKGVLLVVTNEPNSDACSTGGDAFLYQFDYQTGSYVASAPGQIVGMKLGSALAAGFVVYRLPSGQLKLTNIDVAGKKKTEGVNPGSGGALGSRVSWRELY
ncbi:MAG TPA: PilC/PilY family type IV pilus protein [Burkholderiales bacterium]|nr:PilC/PilY family type IV pilus protein [Burkholderiales bacterium]